MKAKVIDYHTLKRQWSAPGVPQVEPYFIVFPFFTREDGATFSMRYHTILPGDHPDPPCILIPGNIRPLLSPGKGHFSPRMERYR